MFQFLISIGFLNRALHYTALYPRDLKQEYGQYPCTNSKYPCTKYPVVELNTDLPPGEQQVDKMFCPSSSSVLLSSSASVITWQVNSQPGSSITWYCQPAPSATTPMTERGDTNRTCIPNYFHRYRGSFDQIISTNTEEPANPCHQSWQKMSHQPKHKFENNPNYCCIRSNSKWYLLSNIKRNSYEKLILTEILTLGILNLTLGVGSAVHVEVPKTPFYGSLLCHKISLFIFMS